MIGALALAGCGGSSRPLAAPTPRPTAATTQPTESASGPDRWVGFGHVAIAVPASWDTNAIHCGTTPTRSTVVINLSAVATCLSPRPAAVEDVQITAGKAAFDFSADRTIQIGDLSAQRQTTACTAPAYPTPYCRGAVYVPSEQVGFLAESDTAARVDALLASIRQMSDRVGVPEFAGQTSYDTATTGRQEFTRALIAAGLRPEVTFRREYGLLGGYVLDSAPYPGTMLRPGDTVEVTVTPPVRDPGDLARFEVSTAPSRKAKGTALDREAVRSGTTVHLHVGEFIVATVDGPSGNNLAGAITGDAVTLVPQKYGAGTWAATRPGRSTITFSTQILGKKVHGHRLPRTRFVLGKVTVIVTR